MPGTAGVDTKAGRGRVYRAGPGPPPRADISRSQRVFQTLLIQSVAILVAFKSQARTTASRCPARRLIAARGAPKKHPRPLYLEQRIVTMHAADDALNRSRRPFPQAAQQASWHRGGDGVRRHMFEIRRHDGHPLLGRALLLRRSRTRQVSVACTRSFRHPCLEVTPLSPCNQISCQFEAHPVTSGSTIVNVEKPRTERLPDCANLHTIQPVVCLKPTSRLSETNQPFV